MIQNPGAQRSVHVRSPMTESTRPATKPVGFLVGLLGLAIAAPALTQDDGLVVEGLRGSIPVAAVSQAIAPRMDDLVRCATSREGRNELASGVVTVAFVIGRDGSTRSTRISASDLGDRDAERCMLQLAARIRFPAPTGGDAEASERIRIPLDAEVRPPVAWQEARARSTAGVAIDRLGARCRVSGGEVRVTAYVGPSGNVVGVGGHASAPALDGTVNCVLDGVRRLPMPSPGSYPAKVSFVVRG